MAAQEVPQAWVTLVPEEVAERLASPDHPYHFGSVAAMGRLLMAHPRIGAPFSALVNEVMFEPGRLDRAEREMLAAVTAAAQDCFY